MKMLYNFHTQREGNIKYFQLVAIRMLQQLPKMKTSRRGLNIMLFSHTLCDPVLIARIFDNG